MNKVKQIGTGNLYIFLQSKILYNIVYNIQKLINLKPEVICDTINIANKVQYVVERN